MPNTAPAVNCRVLVVEDEPAIADTLLYALKTEEFEPTHCLTGRDALGRVEELDPALVILDIGLPDMSGFDLCKTLRRSSAIPVLFLTARRDEMDRVVGLKLVATTM